MNTFDLIVIGGGRGITALSVAKWVKKVALIEKITSENCPNRGCVPSKLLLVMHMSQEP
jgi:pyruvate/2-oxoglutarate dehydrogenase complex dihydrolipoamide dehydrogenase (E3) component